MRGLYRRFAFTFICITCGILLIASIVFILETHYHFALYQHQSMDMGADNAQLNAHFEQALVQSVIWTAVGGIALASVVSLYVAKRMTSPLLEMKAAAMKMAEGNLQARTKLVGNDEITDLGLSFNHLAEQLEKQEQLRKTMTADVAHELRTPLATLKSHMEAMIEGIWEPSAKRLKSCHEEIERLIHLVGDLEQLTHLDSPHFQLHMKSENMVSIASQCVQAMQAAFQLKGVQLTLHKPNEDIFAIVDRQRVCQIIINVLSNALKYTPVGETVAVTMAGDHRSSTATISVRDTGIGIESRELPFIFERFYRTDKSRDRKSGGSGIGLTIAKKLTEAHCGKIEIQSEVGRGTTVQIHFPIKSKKSSLSTQDLQKSRI
ncbi:sensor histidine kinase [Paenibacillus sp. UNC451MF]|uniref:sensor histidine kinase n=1 Tax=Paenibacillus sp. UNC451MF TaxID=1449063 RepID=UPI00049064DE|nr:HAMP domain-containing sensor histidine kinase [Paenibacillus sp. UNC451MF]